MPGGTLPAPSTEEAEACEFQVNLTYTAHSRPTSVTWWDTISNKEDVSLWNNSKMKTVLFRVAEETWQLRMLAALAEGQSGSRDPHQAGQEATWVSSPTGTQLSWPLWALPSYAQTPHMHIIKTKVKSFLSWRHWFALFTSSFKHPRNKWVLKADAFQTVDVREEKCTCFHLSDRIL